MSELNLDHLRKIAEAATPGPWSAGIYRSERRSPKTRRWLKWKPEYGHHGTVSVIDSDGVYGVLDGPDADHIATFDPPTVLALLDALEAAERERRATQQPSVEQIAEEVRRAENLNVSGSKPHRQLLIAAAVHALYRGEEQA